MKYSTALLIMLLAVSISSTSQDLGYKSLEEMRTVQIENIKNPDLWDMERMKEDVNPVKERLPIRDGAFPVPHYSSLGPYKGGGLVENRMARSIPEYRLEVEGKEIVFCSFFIGNSPFYKEENRNKVFFTLITVVDSLNADNFAVGASYFLSRNHPDYGGEGSFLTKNDKIEFVSFTTPDKGSFAVVNMRLFHLEYGNIIVVTPQKDGSFRSMQIEGESVTNEEIYEYVRNNVLKREEVVRFLSADGVI